jgi:hypothetical protein
VVEEWGVKSFESLEECHCGGIEEKLNIVWLYDYNLEKLVLVLHNDYCARGEDSPVYFSLGKLPYRGYLFFSMKRKLAYSYRSGLNQSMMEK